MSPTGRIISLIGIGTIAGDRVWRLKAKDSTRTPFIIVQGIVETPENTHDEDSTIKQTLVQISCYDTGFTAALGLADAVVGLIEGHHAAGPISIQSRREDYDEGITPGLHRHDIDALVWTNG